MTAMTTLTTEEELTRRYAGKPVPVIRRQSTAPGVSNLIDRRGVIVAVAAMDHQRSSTYRKFWRWELSHGLRWDGTGGPESGHDLPSLQSCVDEVAALLEECGLLGVERIVSGPSSMRTFTVYVREGQSRINAETIAEALHDARIPLLSVAEQFDNTRKGVRSGY